MTLSKQAINQIDNNSSDTEQTSNQPDKQRQQHQWLWANNQPNKQRQQQQWHWTNKQSTK